MTNTTDSIASKVRGVAAEKRFTQQRIADIVGISRTSVVERFNGRIPWNAPEILALSIAADVPVARFFPEPSEDAA